MREIKFRAMSLDGKWHIGLLGRDDKHGFCISNAAGSPWAFPARPETIGQYTGLKDKNGVEIYEGDIVRASLLGDGKHHGYKDEVQFRGNGIIDFDPMHLMVNFKDGNRDNFYIYEAILHRETEVIGNIYESPELLK